MEGSLPFISVGNANQVVSMSEIDLGVDFSTAWSIQEIRDVREWVSIFFCDFVESLEVDTEVEQTILLADKQDWSSMSKGGRADEAHC